MVRALGELELAVLFVLWGAPEPLPVRAVLTRLKRRTPLAYTTVLTVLDRLHEKGVVTREKDGKAFLYRPRVSQEQWFGEQAVEVLTDSPAPAGRDALLMAFLDSAERADPALLDHLSTLIAARRRSPR